jgi:hypothetical protein
MSESSERFGGFWRGRLRPEQSPPRAAGATYRSSSGSRQSAVTMPSLPSLPRKCWKSAQMSWIERVYVALPSNSRRPVVGDVEQKLSTRLISAPAAVRLSTTTQVEALAPDKRLPAVIEPRARASSDQYP